MTLGEAITGLGYLVGALVFYLAARRKTLATEGIAQVAGAAFLGGVIGAKLSQWIMSGWPFYIPLTSVLDPRAGGKALLGGVIFGWLGAELMKRKLGIKRSTGDLFALALPAGETIGRIGCFFNGCCYGTACGAPWAVLQHGEWRHPVQLYSSAVALLTFVTVFKMKDRMPREGDLLKLYLILFGVTRFALEFLRDNDTHLLGLSPMQWFCIELTVFGLVTLRRSYLQPAKA